MAPEGTALLVVALPTSPSYPVRGEAGERYNEGFNTDQAGYSAMRTGAKAWPDRVWAVEGSNGAGRPLAQRLLEAGEQVVDVNGASLTVDGGWC